MDFSSKHFHSIFILKLNFQMLSHLYREERICKYCSPAHLSKNTFVQVDSVVPQPSLMTFLSFLLSTQAALLYMYQKTSYTTVARTHYSNRQTLMPLLVFRNWPPSSSRLHQTEDCGEKNTRIKSTMPSQITNASKSNSFVRETQFISKFMALMTFWYATYNCSEMCN